MNRRHHHIRRAEHHSLNELNITPLLDLVFVLLVIFIITTPQLTHSLEINLPSASQPQPQAQNAKPDIHRIRVDAQGRPHLNGTAHTLASLKADLLQHKANDATLAVVVEGADEVAYQRMIDVLDLLQQLEISRVGLATGTDAAP